MTASFPVLAGTNGATATGTLNCIVLPPKLTTAKRFRKLGRAGGAIADRYNAMFAERTGLASEIQAADSKGEDTAALQAKYDALSDQLDQIDQSSFDSIVGRARSVLLVASFTPDVPPAPEDAPTLQPTLENVNWDDVDLSAINAVNSFFSASIGA